MEIETQGQQNKLDIRISVRALVEFLLRAGDIDNRRVGAPENAMQEGGRIHRMIQRRMGEGYVDEVFLRYQHETENYVLTIEGRADGIYTEKNEDIRFIPESGEESLEIIAEDIKVTIDEIKGTYRNLDKITKPVPEHLAQAKMYAFIYATQQNLKTIHVRMTYCNIETEEVRYFYEEYTIHEITKWFEDVMAEYQKWADYESKWRMLRQQSIKEMQFPFEYREGQKQLVSYVYQTIHHKKKLFIEAPTGVGKTISTVYPSIKAMSEGMGDKLFYLTAKTITRTVAENTFSLLRERGLKFKSVILTAKEKICFMEEVECNPDHCPYAKGHYDRINDAIYDLLTHEDSFTRENIEAYAIKHQVCPFEFCLDMSLYADSVICDYNYVFDPHVYLKRFFGDGNSGDYLFLVDEGHNLLDRGRDMYSAVLRKEDILELKKKIHVALSTSATGRIHEYGGKLEKILDKCNREMLVLKKECENFQVVEFIDPFVQSVNRLYDVMSEYLEDHDDNAVRKDILDYFFEIAHFLEIYELVDDKYVMYTEFEEDGSFILKLFCVDPSTNLRLCMDKARSSILFSATFLPIQYYKKLLGGRQEDFEVYAKSVFDPEKRALFIGSDVTTKFTRRNEDEYFNIAKYIRQIIKNRHGNYMVFFPSFAFMQEVYGMYQEFFAEENVECLVQDSFMNEEAREAFLARFEGAVDDRSLIGFCVMGGIFSEGIDLKHDSLIGVIVAGTGLPQVCNERELLKAYFDADGENGFDYAYRYPGMNKVLQAAGRVIRTVDDVGIIALLDERFLQQSYQRLFPREWMNFEAVNLQTISKRVERFWDSWL